MNGPVVRLQPFARKFTPRKGIHLTMAQCSNCGKKPVFGHNVSFSKRATNREFRPNLQKVTVVVGGKKVKKTLCTKCIKGLAKTR